MAAWLMIQPMNVYLMGGRTDPDPQQSNDESSTNLIEIWNQSTETWSLAQFSMPNAQQYHECVQIDDKIYAIGDWYPGVTPSQKSTGQVQIYDLTTSSWQSTTFSMPATKEVGNFGMASIGQKIYIAGGVQDSNANDATDRLLEYDTVTGLWTELANMSEKRFAFPLVEYHGLLYALEAFKDRIRGVRNPYSTPARFTIHQQILGHNCPTCPSIDSAWLHRFTMMRSSSSEVTARAVPSRILGATCQPPMNGEKWMTSQSVSSTSLPSMLMA